MKAQSTAEVQALLQAERSAQPFLAFRDDAGSLVIHTLGPDKGLLTVGRDPSCDLALPWDDLVSRTHAVLERLGHAWTLADDGISRNGTFLNGARLSTRQRLDDGDTVRVGGTMLTFRHPGRTDSGVTNVDSQAGGVELTTMQRKVLVALCRPFQGEASRYAVPATNSQIAAELVLSVEAVKTHMRSLFERFQVGDLPQNQKRARVAELALEQGVVSRHELEMVPPGKEGCEVPP
jgi:pSer/pThr/pTyr-binding forkhead associated (FHA) protein